VSNRAARIRKHDGAIFYIAKVFADQVSPILVLQIFRIFAKNAGNILQKIVRTYQSKQTTRKHIF